MLGRTLIALMLLLPLGLAIGLVSPRVENVQNGDIIDLGTIGPGQSVTLLIDRKVATGGIHGEGGFYDQALVGELPRGWTSQDSKLYQDPIQVIITANPEAGEGNYSTRIIVIDEGNGEELGNVSFIVRMRITYDIMDFSVLPKQKAVGPGQPAKFSINITNKGSTSDVFMVSAEGPKRWEFSKPIFVPAQSTRSVPYEIVGEEEETYHATIKVVSTASQMIHEEENVTLFVRSDLFGDYKAANNGVLVFPIFEAPVHALAGLLSNLFG